MYQPKVVSARMKTPITKESVFTFGKHKGKTVGDVLIFDPSYLEWCLDRLDWFDVDTGLEDEIYEAYEDDILYTYDYGLDPYDFCD